METKYIEVHNSVQNQGHYSSKWPGLGDCLRRGLTEMLIPGRDKLGASHRRSTLGMKPPLTSTGYVHPLKDAAIGLCDPMTAACQASLSITNSQSLLKLMSIELVMPSNHLILCHPFLFLPSIFPRIRVFSNESVLHIMWPEYLSFSFSISPSSVYSGLISLRIDLFDLLAVPGTLKSLL